MEREKQLLTAASKFVFEVISERVSPLIIQSSAAKNWSGIRIERQIRQPNQISFPPAPVHLLFHALKDVPRQIFKFGGRNYQGRRKVGETSILPIGTQSFCAWDASSDLLVVSLDAEVLERVALETYEIDPARIELLPEATTDDENLKLIFSQLVNEMGDTALLGDKMYGEILTTQLALHLLRRYAKHNKLPEFTVENGLPPLVRGRLEDYIQSNLAESISLSDLAQIAGISRYHFLRVFKKTFGTPPHRYLLKVRVKHAQLLLKQTSFELKEIALLCGFNNQSHFTVQFRRTAGVTPKQWRLGSY